LKLGNIGNLIKGIDAKFVGTKELKILALNGLYALTFGNALQANVLENILVGKHHLIISLLSPYIYKVDI
jgi:hypothetical protein